jgi:tellurite resistance protein TerC
MTILYLTISTLLILDLFVLNKFITQSENKLKISLVAYGFYITIAILFGIYIYYNYGYQRSIEYFTGYIIESALSLDNIFIMSFVFEYFRIKEEYQRRVLFYGILGVIVLRGIMIYLGVKLIASYYSIMYFFAIIMIISGLKILKSQEEQKEDLNNNSIIMFIKKYFNVSDNTNTESFYEMQNGKVFLTPVAIALICIEIFDLVFAIDSLPAIFAITHNTFVIYSSNIFAILGLRSLYGILKELLKSFQYLKYSLGVLLIFIGFKIFISHTAYEISITYSLLITIGILMSGILFSVYKK